MDIRHLAYFIEVAQQKSFTKAAQALHITQPSISKTIKLLEEELGVLLFDRTSRQIDLTDGGKAVYNQALKIVNSFENLTSELSDVMDIKKGRLRIGIPTITSSTLFPKIIGEFHKQYPHIQIELQEVGSKTVLSAIDEGTIDIGVVCTPPTEAPHLGMLSFVKDPLMVIVHPSHPIAKLTEVDFSDLEPHSFVMYPRDFSLYDAILTRCTLSGFRPRIICETSQRSFMCDMVSSNLGIALLPQTICQKLDPSLIKVLPSTEPQLFLQLNIVWNNEKYLSYAAKSFISYTSSLLEHPQRETNVGINTPV